MDFPSFLLRQHWLKKAELLEVAWTAIKAESGKTSDDGYLEPSLREMDSSCIPLLRPYPFGDVLQHRKEILNQVFLRSGYKSFDDVVDAWHRWHIEFVQPISDFCLSPRAERTFGKRLYENEEEKRLCAEYISSKIIRDADHVVIPEGTSAFWVGLAALCRRRNLRIITSNGPLIREIYENPLLRDRATAVTVIGGDIDMDIKSGGSASRGFVGMSAQVGFGHAISREPGATVVVSSVNGLTPDHGPFAPCPISSFTRHAMLRCAFDSSVRKVIFVADYTKMRPSCASEYGEAIFADKKQWNSIVEQHRDRFDFVVAPPPQIRKDAAVLNLRPQERVIHGRGYPQLVVDYLNCVATFEKPIREKGLNCRIYEVAESPSNDKAQSFR